MEKIEILQLEIQKWSDEQFGKHRTALPIAMHLKKEVDELIEGLKDVYSGVYANGQEDPSELLIKKLNAVRMEYADCLMLLMDSAAHFNITMHSLIEATSEKLEINKNRKWGKPDENGVVEHIKS